MAIMNSVRRLFTRRRPMELTVTHRQDLEGDPMDLILSANGEDQTPEDGFSLTTTPESDPEEHANEPLAVLGRIEQALEQSTTSGTALVESAQKLPEVARSLSSLSERQKELVELTRNLHDIQQSRSETERATNERLSDSLDRQSETLSLVQRQLDANHQIASQTAEHLAQVSEGLSESMNASRRTGEAMSALVGELRTREARTAERFTRLQGWMIACTIAGLATIISAITLAWVILSNNSAS